jgi:transposase
MTSAPPLEPNRLPPAGRPLTPLTASAEERKSLEDLTRGGNARLARRASIILACLEGASNRSVAARFRISKQAVGKWRARYQTHRLRGLLDQPRSGAPRRIKPPDVARVIGLTLQPPPAGAPRWTTRSMARVAGLSQTTVNRIWRLHGIAPHRVETPPVPQTATASAAPAPATTEATLRPDENAPFIGELRRDLAGLARMLNEANPAALRVAVDAVEAAVLAAAGSAHPQRRATALSPDLRARQEARWRKARELFEAAKAALSEAQGAATLTAEPVGRTRRP